ncbi:hypothetical protein [Streptomyces sp. SID13726]|uniref:hypothetical protein n=1 Tax=Streptomyces sp. SID13726 TaxID=2706058 RepID=UPI0013BA46CB|nr:hypothetical protein [Streptomyces sp. SID13726]NEB04453.1 hypothetical protein [Streptomyces sp. SID13726]
MNWVLVVATSVLVGALLVLGVVQVVTGWAPPWVRDTILRPRLSGVGTLVSAAGLGVFVFLGPLGGVSDRHLYIPLLGLMATGVGTSLFQRLARRPAPMRSVS